ncbi:reverse transcriptase [Phytophthora megakarya]|uniref:Reverse transcriptase n=1 Tax=Phytophthora megakarya TaxID=4795 RepID=A0A225W7M0_9STRA|nr:reverse transcriptase [Phytophthora megakarya]
MGREGDTLLRWLVKLDTAVMARRLVDPLAKVAFSMSCLGGRVRGYGRRLTDPTCFSTYESFKEELKLAFDPPQNEFRSKVEFLDLKQGKHDVHAYAQRARYLVSNVVTDPMDEATKVVMHKEFNLKQAKFHTNVPRPPRPAAKTEGPEPMDLSYASAVGQQKSKGSNVRCFRRELEAKDLYDGRIEQLCILSERERMTSEAEELRQLFAGSATESEDTLSAKTKKERFEEQSWDSLKSSPYYEILREHREVLPGEILAELPQDKGIQHEIDLVSGTKDYESKSPHSAPTFCVIKPQGGWHIVHAYNKLNDATIPAQTPIPRKDVIIDSMSKSTIYSALDLRDGFYQILMRENDIPLTAVSTPSGMFWDWLVMPHGLKNAHASFNRCVTHLLRSVRDFAPSYFDDVYVHSRAVNDKTDIEMHKEHLRQLLGLMRKHKLYANLKKCIFGDTRARVSRWEEWRTP